MDSDDRMLWQRTFKKWDAFELSIKDLCTRTASIEEKVDRHLADQEKRAAKKERVFYVGIAAIGGIFGFIQVLSNM